MNSAKNIVTNQIFLRALLTLDNKHFLQYIDESRIPVCLIFTNPACFRNKVYK